jgi:hypothetical protein
MIPSVLDFKLRLQPLLRLRQLEGVPARPARKPRVRLGSRGRASPALLPVVTALTAVEPDERSRMPPTGTIVGGSSPATDGASTGLDQHEDMGCAILRGYVARHFRRRRRE